VRRNRAAMIGDAGTNTKNKLINLFAKYKR